MSNVSIDGMVLVDLGPILAGDVEPVRPTVLRRSDGVALFYTSAINAVSAEPESGKTWLTLAAAAEQIDAGQHVVYIDWEMTAYEVVARLLALGVGRSDIAQRFHYVRFDDGPTVANRDALVEHAKSLCAPLVVFDGLAEALAQSRYDENSNGDVAEFYDLLIRPMARAGAAVVIVDHVVKASDERKRWARGAGHKLSAITGASYSLSVVEPFGRGRRGRSTLVLTKDRHASVSFLYQGRTRFAGELVVDSTEEAVAVSVTAPTEATSVPGGSRPTWYMEQISQVIERAPDPLTLRALQERVKGRKQYVGTAIDLLVSEGYVERVDGPRGAKLHRSIRPYRQENDPSSDRYVGEPSEDEAEDAPF